MSTTDPFAAFTEDPDPETALLLEQLRAAAPAAPPITTFTAQQLRAAIEQSAVAPPRREDGIDREVPGPGGPVPVRILGSRPSPRAVYLHIHGGGWIGGAHDHRDEGLHAFAERLDAVVVSAGYRLAPEHPFPAALDDCEAAAVWLVENARAEFGTDTLLIGGDSAGAHLSAVTVLRMRDRHGYSGFRAVDLRYGCYDLRLAPSVRLWQQGGLDRTNLEYILDFIVPKDRRDDPDVSPLFADLSGLPPAIFTCGTGDSLVDDSLFMWARWRAAGNRAELALYPGAPHAFDHAPTGQARAAVERIAMFLETALATEAVTA